SVRETHPREGAMTTPEENAATVRELIERVMNEGDIGFAEKPPPEDYPDRSPMPGGTADKAGAIAMFNMMRSQTPDMHIEVEEVIASDNKVAVHSTMTGTDTMGFMPGMSPTGKPFRLDAIDVFTFNDAGLNSEHYGVYDMMGTMAQLGLMEMPGPPAEGLRLLVCGCSGRGEHTHPAEHHHPVGPRGSTTPVTMRGRVRTS